MLRSEREARAEAALPGLLGGRLVAGLGELVELGVTLGSEVLSGLVNGRRTSKVITAVYKANIQGKGTGPESFVWALSKSKREQNPHQYRSCNSHHSTCLVY